MTVNLLLPVLQHQQPQRRHQLVELHRLLDHPLCLVQLLLPLRPQVPL